MEKDLRLLVGNINQTLKELDYVSYLKKVALSKGKKGEYQSHRLKSNYLKRKLISLKGALNKKLHGTYIVAQFNFIRGEQKETFEQNFYGLISERGRRYTSTRGSFKTMQFRNPRN